MKLPSGTAAIASWQPAAPPTCQTCGKSEWGHACSGKPPETKRMTFMTPAGANPKIGDRVKVTGNSTQAPFGKIIAIDAKGHIIVEQDQRTRAERRAAQSNRKRL